MLTGSISVFLRILEFYTGVLFLTTNRTGVLDEAFMSRIHTQLYYPPLDEVQSSKIWETNLRKLSSRKGATMQINIDEVLDYAHWHYRQNANKSTSWNGRQIRNACQTAAALAEHEALCKADDYHYNAASTPIVGEAGAPAARLEVRHFEKVDTAVREFHEYMADVCGDDYATVAKMRGERADDFNYQPPSRYHSQDQFSPGTGQLVHNPQQRPNMYSPRESYRDSNHPGGHAGMAGGYAPPPQHQPFPRTRFASFDDGAGAGAGGSPFGRSHY